MRAQAPTKAPVHVATAGDRNGLLMKLNVVGAPPPLTELTLMMAPAPAPDPVLAEVVLTMPMNTRSPFWRPTGAGTERVL